MPISHRTQIGFTLVLYRYPVGITAVSHRYHNSVTPVSYQYHISIASLYHWYHVDIAPMAHQYHIGLSLVSHRRRIDIAVFITSLSHRLRKGVISIRRTFHGPSLARSQGTLRGTSHGMSCHLPPPSVVRHHDCQTSSNWFVLRATSRSILPSHNQTYHEGYCSKLASEIGFISVSLRYHVDTTTASPRCHTGIISASHLRRIDVTRINITTVSHRYHISTVMVSCRYGNDITSMPHQDHIDIAPLSHRYLVVIRSVLQQ